VSTGWRRNLLRSPHTHYSRVLNRLCLSWQLHFVALSSVQLSKFHHIACAAVPWGPKALACQVLSSSSAQFYSYIYQVPTEAEQPLLGGSHVNEDGLEREAVRAAARQHVSCHGGSCDDNKELAS